MKLLNDPDGFGALTKAFHWIVVLLFAFQLASAFVMVRLEDGERVLGLDGNAFYDWHKTIGLLALAVTVPRLAVRQVGRLPDWPPSVTALERRVAHQAERVLYLVMFLLPFSGFVFVMAGGYGVRLAGLVPLPNPLMRSEALAEAARLLHVGSAVLFGLALAAHLGFVLRHALILRDGLLRRMLPAAAARPGRRPGGPSRPPGPRAPSGLRA
jgi:cytochrome b561